MTYSQEKEIEKMKKLVAVLLAVAMTFGISTTAFAITPHYHSWVPDIPDLSEIELPDGWYEDINTLDEPVVSSAMYRHQRMFWDPARLQVDWTDVDEAEYYKVRITTKDGVSKEYTTSNSSIYVYSRSDDFAKECLRSGTVQVMACSDTITNSDWSDQKTISCNSIHRVTK